MSLTAPRPEIHRDGSTPEDRRIGIPGQLSALTTSRGEIYEKIVNASKYTSIKWFLVGWGYIAVGWVPISFQPSPRPFLLCCGVNVSGPPVGGFPLAAASLPLEGLLAIGAEQAGAGSPQTRGPVTGSGVVPVLQAEFPLIMHSRTLKCERAATIAVQVAQELCNTEFVASVNDFVSQTPVFRPRSQNCWETRGPRDRRRIPRPRLALTARMAGGADLTGGCQGVIGWQKFTCRNLEMRPRRRH